MSLLETTSINCPYCGEAIELVIDCSTDQQVYIEDCEVCCRPIHLNISIDEYGQIHIVASHEND